MGYHTDFSGEFRVTPTLSAEHRAYLEKFSETRRFRRKEEQTKKRPDPIREAVGLPVGPEGAYFVGEEGFAGQGANYGTGIPDVKDYSLPPAGQPGLWCQWTPNTEGTAIEWDGGEKFYHYIEWIKYLIKHFLKPWGYTLHGEVEWTGEERSDLGLITIENNEVIVKTGRITYEDTY